MATESASSITQLRRFMTRHSVTIQDFDGTSHTAEVTASSLFEAVAQNLRRLGATLRRSGECSVRASPALAPNAIEAATIRKVQTRIIPLVFFLFLIAFIDRINIGFAALTMNKALAITSQQFGLLSGIFFWDYFLFEIPSNLLLHKLGARMWIARILVLGNSGDADGLGDNSNPLYILRFLRLVYSRVESQTPAQELA